MVWRRRMTRRFGRIRRRKERKIESLAGRRRRVWIWAVIEYCAVPGWERKDEEAMGNGKMAALEDERKAKTRTKFERRERWATG